MADDDVARRLDMILAVLQLAFHDKITEAARAIRADPVNAGILEEAAEGWVRSGELQRRVAASRDVSPRTIRDRLQTLVARRALEQQGNGPSTEYRSTGLV